MCILANVHFGKEWFQQIRILTKKHFYMWAITKGNFSKEKFCKGKFCKRKFCKRKFCKRKISQGDILQGVSMTWQDGKLYFIKKVLCEPLSLPLFICQDLLVFQRYLLFHLSTTPSLIAVKCQFFSITFKKMFPCRLHEKIVFFFTNLLTCCFQVVNKI